MNRLPIGRAAALVCAGLFANSASAQLTLLSNISANQPGGTSAGEIVSFDPFTDRLFVTSSGGSVHRVNIFDLSNPSAPTTLGTADFSTAFGAAANTLSLSSVKADPLGRFGVVSLIPTANTTTPGKIGFFNLSTGAIIGTTDVGFHPDSVTISPDGNTLVVVNEGEFSPGSTNAPGSISVLNISGINSGNLATLPSLAVTTTDFSSGNLGSGVSLSGLRNSNIAAVGTAGTFIGSVPDFTLPANIDPNAIEPEFATISGEKVFVSLQENNAIGEYDLATNQWTKITYLGKIEQTIDASDQDSTIALDDVVKGLPMPDTIASYTVAGKTYVVSANEGDARVDDRDVSRFGDTGGDDDMDPILDDNYPATATGVRAASALGRLNVSRIDGDTDGDGKIDEITMLGTRSMTIWEQTAGGLVKVADTGSLFEQYIKDNDNAGFVDGRSDDKGPEPEGLTLGVIDGKTYAFIGMERTNSIFMIDITDLTNPFFFDYIRVVDGSDTPLRPEGFEFVSADNSPTGQALLIVGYEGDGTLASSERVAIFSVVPEPATIGLLAMGGVALLRRRRH